MRVGIETYPKMLDPRRGMDGFSYRTNQLIYCGLARLNDSLENIPWAAEKIIKLSPKSYKILLRKDLKFHDGSRVTTADVVATFSPYLREHVKRFGE